LKCAAHGGVARQHLAKYACFVVPPAAGERIAKIVERAASPDAA
jgi:hypothetical protein